MSGNEQVEASQSFESPTVYLDHWAVRRLSETPATIEQFASTLRARGGTLVLWHLNFAEFAATANQTAEKGEDFFEAALPNVYFIDMDLDQTIAQEQVPRPHGREQRPPIPDLELLRFVASRGLSTNPFSLRGLLSVVKDHKEQIDSMLAETAASLVAKVVDQREKGAFVAKARTYRPKALVPRTKVVFAELMRATFLDKNLPFGVNDAIDLLHVAIPVSYCDFALLDGKWEESFRQTSKRVLGLDPPIQLGQCFSERRDGLNRFLQELESWEP